MAREELGLADIESPEEAHENVVLALNNVVPRPQTRYQLYVP